MKSHAIQTAQVEFDQAEHGGVPYAPAYGDLYHARAGAWQQAQHVFLAGNGLPQRWAQRPRFVVLETGFGLGNNFLATWAAWRADPKRPQRLVFISVEKHPLVQADLARAHLNCPAPELAAALVARWPVATHDLHSLSFDAGAVTLLLALGDAHTWLPELVAQVDAVYLDGFAPARNAELWDEHIMKACARLAAPDATVATWSVARRARDALSAASFEVRKAPGFAVKPDMTVARLRERQPGQPRLGPPPGRQAAPRCRTAVVIGAGLAGAAAARALAAQGVQVTVLEQHAEPAQETSGNPAGLFHGVVHPHDGAHAQLLRAAALRTAQLLQAPTTRGELPGAVQGLLRGTQAAGLPADDGDETPDTLANQASRGQADDRWHTMQATLKQLGLPAGFAQALQTEAAAQRSGLPLTGPAWYLPGGGWVSPPALVRRWLNEPGITLRCCAQVQALVPGTHQPETGWTALDAQGQALASADVVVLANAHGLQALLAPHTDVADWPLSRSRGQVSWWPEAAARAAGLPQPQRPLASGSYAIRLPAELGGGLLCGATNQLLDDDPQVRDADHAQNLARLASLTGVAIDSARALAAGPQGRVGWRLACADRLPLLGPVPAPQAQLASIKRLEQPRHVPRVPGLYVLSALGSRGLTLAPLLGEALAAWITGAPSPLGASLLDAVDVARFVSRAARKSG